MNNGLNRIVAIAGMALLAGCAAAPMRDATYQRDVDASHALVTFVRQSVWMGDGINVYLWDGDTFIGTLGAGTLVQYKAAPGPHIFMGNSENWSYVKADLKPGKHYVIKANMFPGVMTMRSALTPVENTDERIATWPTTMQAREVIPEKQDKYVSDRKASAAAALAAFNEGSVKFAELTEAHAR